MALEGLIKRLDNVINLNIDVVVENILKDEGFQRFIIDLNTEEQLFEKGIDSLGASLGDYTDFTIAVKNIKSQRIDHITLFDTGDFYKSFKIKVQNGGFLIIADGEKEDGNILDRFQNAVGLTDESLQIVIDAIREKIIPLFKI